MIILRWLWFALVFCGWIVVVTTIWHRAGWTLGVIVLVAGFLSVLELFESTLMKQWHMEKIVTWEESE